MNILLVTPWTLSEVEVNGVTLAVKMLAAQFHKQGHQVLVLILNGEGNPVYLGKSNDASTYSAYLRVPYIDYAPLKGLISFAIHLPITLWRLHGLLAKNKIEVVNIVFPLANGFYFAILKWISNWKLVVTYQGHDAHGLAGWPRIERYLVKFLLSNVDCIFAVSKSLHLKVTELFPTLRQKKHRIIGNGAPLDLIDQINLKELPDLPGNYVFSAGNLIHRKGFDVLIKAIGLALKRGVQINVVIAGDGPEREALAILSNEVGVSDSVRFVGAKSHVEVLTLMKGSRFFVLASRAEGLALVIPEAMGCGKAVIATDVDGSSEIVQDGKTGILFKCDDAEFLADALIRLWSDRLFCEEVGKNALECALKEHTWEAIASRYQKVFCEL